MRLVEGREGGGGRGGGIYEEVVEEEGEEHLRTKREELKTRNEKERKDGRFEKKG